MNKLDKILMNHNICPGYNGYAYIKTIVKSKLLKKNINITQVYKYAALKHNTLPSRVERSIRHVLSKSDICKTNKIALSILTIEYEGMI